MTLSPLLTLAHFLYVYKIETLNCLLTRNMKIPKKINPDNLKDSIVQIVFNTGIAPELFLGTFNNILSDIFKFSVGFPKQKELKVTENNEIILEGGFFLDTNESIKVNVSSNVIVFNSYKNYIGWDHYFPIIKTTIEKLFATNLIKEIKRIGIRYISQFDNTSLIDNLNMNLSIDIPNKNLEATQIRTEFTEGEFRIILTLINKIKQLQGDTKKDLNTSIIDIDVIQLPANLNNSKTTLEAIENGHQKQKAVFFSLLKPTFLETLNPEY